MLTDVIAENTAAIREHLERQREDSTAFRAAMREMRAALQAELVEHRAELVALRRTSDLQTEELRRGRDRSDAQTRALTLVLERLEGGRA